MCQGIESLLGRLRENGSKYSDRNIDIDILFYDDKIVNIQDDDTDLIIPHPRVHERAFMLVPLLEIAPAYVHPVLNKTISDIYEEIDDPEAVVLYGTRFM